MENHHVSWLNPAFLWPCSIANCWYNQKVILDSKRKISISIAILFWHNQKLENTYFPGVNSPIDDRQQHQQRIPGPGTISPLHPGVGLGSALGLRWGRGFTNHPIITIKMGAMFWYKPSKIRVVYGLAIPTFTWIVGPFATRGAHVR